MVAATFLTDGRGDVVAGLLWLRRVAEANLDGALVYLAGLYRAGDRLPKDYTEAIRLLEKSKQIGSHRGKLELGILYLQSEPPKSLMALELFQELAQEGYAAAMFWIGKMFEEGLGTTRDVAEAVKWYSRSSAAGFTEAKECLARLSARN